LVLNPTVLETEGDGDKFETDQAYQALESLFTHLYEPLETGMVTQAAPSLVDPKQRAG
jgi:hypothetical protein